MRYTWLLAVIFFLGAPVTVVARSFYKQCFNNCNPCLVKKRSCFSCCDIPYCGPYPRPLPGQYDSFKDNTRIKFWNIRPCAPRNESANRGYLYKGLWWDNEGVRYWAVRNNTDNTITVEGLEGGEIKNIPSGDVVNIARGESYSFRMQAPAKRFQLFNSDIHNIEAFINAKGDLAYRAEPKVSTAIKKEEIIMPKL